MKIKNNSLLKTMLKLKKKLIRPSKFATFQPKYFLY